MQHLLRSSSRWCVPNSANTFVFWGSTSIRYIIKFYICIYKYFSLNEKAHKNCICLRFKSMEHKSNNTRVKESLQRVGGASRECATCSGIVKWNCIGYISVTFSWKLVDETVRKLMNRV